MIISELSQKDRAKLFARLSALAYSDNATAEAKVMGFSTTKFYDRDGAQAYRFQNKNDIVIACRGTQPAQFNDIKADLKATPVRSETVGHVHKGFKTEVDDLWSMIKKDLERPVNRNRNLWFTGHSLGAAMTTIMASRCEDDPDMPCTQEVYTYGSPRVGWKKYVKSLSITHHRYVNNNDIVTRVPFNLMGYVHHGQEHYFNAYGYERKASGWQRIKDRFRGLWMGLKSGSIDSFSDHSMDNYISNLDKDD